MAEENSNFPSDQPDNNQELIVTVNSLNQMLRESITNLAHRLERLEQHVRTLSEQGASSAGATKSGGTAGGSDLHKELQNQVLYLESQINRVTNELKTKQDERHNQLRDRLEAQVKSMEKLFEKNKKDLNKHSFNFAILVIIIMVIGAFIMKSGLDHLTNYLTGQMDSIHLQLDRLLESGVSDPSQQMERHFR